MIEMFIIAAIVSSMTLRVAGNVAVDGLFAARGKESPRYTRAKARRAPGAATRYWSEVWDDVWTNASAKRSARKSGATPVLTPKPRGAATRFFSGLAQDGRRAVGRRWDDGWSRLDEKRRTKATRPRPGQVTVPGTIVPNAQDGDGDRPQDRPVPVPEPRVVPYGDEGRTDLRFGEDEDDPTGVRSCPECHGTGLVDGEICLSCRDRQEQRNQHHEDQVRPDSGPDYDPSPATPTTEGPTMTTIPTGEVTGLSDMINFCEGSTVAFNAQIHATELSIAAAEAGGVTGPGAAKLAHAMELCAAASAAYSEAAAEYKSHLIVTEAYDAVPGAGTREFVTAGR